MSTSAVQPKNRQLLVAPNNCETPSDADKPSSKPKLLSFTPSLQKDEAIYLLTDNCASLQIITNEGEQTLRTAEELFGRELLVGAVSFTSTELVCISRDLAMLATIPLRSPSPDEEKRAPVQHVFPRHRLPNFTVTSGASNDLYYLLCDAVNNQICILLGNALKFFYNAATDSRAEPRSGSPSVATLGSVVTAVSTNSPDVLFYVLEKQRIRAVTRNAITTIPLRVPKDGHLPNNWPRDLNSIAVGSRGEIYVADAECVAIIEHGIARRFKSFGATPISLGFSYTSKKLFIRLDNHTIEDADTAVVVANDRATMKSSNVVLTTVGLPYKPLSLHIPGVFPIYLWSVIASHLDNSEICRVRLIHPRLSAITNLRLSYHLQLQKSTSGLDLFTRIFDSRLHSLLPHLTDFKIGCHLTSSQGFGQASSAQARSSLPTLHIPANLSVEPVKQCIWPLHLQRLRLEIPISFESSNSLLASLQTLELHNSIGLGPQFLEHLPLGLTRLCLPHLTQPVALCSLPQGLIYLDLASALLASDSLKKPLMPDEKGVLRSVPLLPNLTTLIISSSDLSIESVGLLPANITHLGAEKAEWLTETTVPLIPRSITRLDARQAIYVTDACASFFPQGLLHLDLGRNLIITNTFIKKLSEQCLNLEVLDITHSSLISPYCLPYISLFYRLRRFIPPVQFMRDIQQEHIFHLPRSLEELDLTDCSRLEMPRIDAKTFKARKDAVAKSSLFNIGPQTPSSPTIETVFRSFNPFSLPIELPFGALHKTSWLPPALKSLKLGFMAEFPEQAFYLLPPTLTHLSLKQCQVVNEEGFKAIGKLLPELKYLNMKYVRGLAPEALSELPRSLTGLVLPSATQSVLYSTNFHSFSSLPLTELKLHHPNILFDSSVFFLLPPTLTLLSIPYLFMVHSMHWALLPIDLKVLKLPRVGNAEDEPLRDLPHLLEELDLSGSKGVSTEGVKRLNQLKSVSLGMSAETLHEKVQERSSKPLADSALIAAELINDLPRSLTSISLPLYFMDPQPVSNKQVYVIDTTSFVNYPNLRHLVIGKQSSYKLAPKSAISPLATIDQEGIRRAPAAPQPLKS